PASTTRRSAKSSTGRIDDRLDRLGDPASEARIHPRGGSGARRARGADLAGDAARGNRSQDLPAPAAAGGRRSGDPWWSSVSHGPPSHPRTPALSLRGWYGGHARCDLRGRPANAVAAVEAAAVDRRHRRSRLRGARAQLGLSGNGSEAWAELSRTVTLKRDRIRINPASTGAPRKITASALPAARKPSYTRDVAR